MRAAATPDGHLSARAEQADWLADEIPDVTSLAMVLTGRADLAAELTAAAFGIGRRMRSQPRLRDLVVREYLQQRRYQPRRPRAAASGRPAFAGGTGAVAGLGTLTPLQRAVLALRVVEHLTVSEVAAIVDRSPAAAQTEFVAACTALDLDSDGRAAGPDGRRSLESLGDLVGRAPSAERVRQEGEELGRRRLRRRSRTAVLMATLVVVVALAVVLPGLVVRFLPVPTRAAGEWTMISRVKPPQGWRLLERTVAPDWESTRVVPTDNDSERPSCTVQVFRPGTLDVAALPGDRVPARVQGRRGFFASSAGGQIEAYLAWPYTENGWATATCETSGRLDKETLATLAGAVRYGRSELMLPFGLDSVPAGYHIESATENLASPSADVVLAVDKLEPGTANLSLTFTPLDVPSQSGFSRTIRLPSGVAFIDQTPGNPRLCLPEQDRYVCIAGYWPLGDWPVRAPLPVNLTPTLIDVSQTLRIAPVLMDKASWLPAAQALP